MLLLFFAQTSRARFVMSLLEGDPVAYLILAVVVACFALVGMYRS